MRGVGDEALQRLGSSELALLNRLELTHYFLPFLCVTSSFIVRFLISLVRIVKGVEFFPGTEDDQCKVLNIVATHELSMHVSKCDARVAGGALKLDSGDYW